ncbi:MAG: 16S rRNA (cytidine(1402)-2'-O)-methyltransferase [Microthrixaceae bacterium]
MGEGPARLVLVGTPIGNLGDLPPRAAEAFAAADVVACEDTRRTGRLLQHLGIRAPKLVRLDEHTEHSTASELIRRITVDGQVIAVASDAGMPGLSDPGALIVKAAAEADVLIEVIPGPFAGAVALVGSGLLDATGRFVFEGFLPRKGAERQSRLAQLTEERRTIVLYEAPHRLIRTLADLADALGPERGVALCRELTKLHEETFRGSLAEALAHSELVAPRGEYVVVVEAAPQPEEVSDEQLLAALGVAIDGGSSRRDAAMAVAGRFGVGLNRVKGLALGS